MDKELAELIELEIDFLKKESEKDEQKQNEENWRRSNDLFNPKRRTV